MARKQSIQRDEQVKQVQAETDTCSGCKSVLFRKVGVVIQSNGSSTMRNFLCPGCAIKFITEFEGMCGRAYRGETRIG